MQILLILALLFAILIAVFAVQNTQQVAVQIVALRFEAVPVSLVVLVSATLGALLIFVVGLVREVRQRLTVRSLRSTIRTQTRTIEELEKRVAQLEGELNALRARPAAAATEPAAAPPVAAPEEGPEATTRPVQPPPPEPGPAEHAR